MNPENPNQHLSDLTTMWSMVLKAKEGEGEETRDALQKLLARYEGAIRRYLLASLRDPDAVDEVFQEFSLIWVSGGFHNVKPQQDPQRDGSFRGYVKTVLRRLILRYKVRQQQRPGPLPLDFPEPLIDPEVVGGLDADLDVSWREELLKRCAALLAEAEARGGPPFATVLRLRRDHPKVRSKQLAEMLSEHLNKAVTADALRKWLERAREKFADLLVEEVAQTLDDPTGDQLEEELIEVGLYEYCRAALVRRAQGE